MWWVGCVTIPGVILLVLALALYFAAWGWLANRILVKGRATPFTPLILLPASWVALEYIRSHLLTGLGWNLLGHTQWNCIPVIQIAGVTGVWGVSFLVMMVNVALSVSVKGVGWRVKGINLGVAGIFLCAALFYGHVVLRQFPAPSTRHPTPVFKVALLQGNIPQTQKWNDAFEEAIWKRYAGLAAEAVKRRPDLIVWPETAVPGYLDDPAVANRLREIVRSGGTEALVGAPTEDPENNLAFNSAILLNRAGEERQIYSKIHLVPFGEFIPIKPVFGWLKKFYPVADFAPGKEWTVFRSPAPFSVLVCFEDLFPELCRTFTRRGAGWLFVITNDAWFGRSAASVQHLQASVFRAVESRVWVGRAANTGWTGFVDPAGRRLPAPGQVSRFKAGIATAELPVIAHSETLYVRWGDWFPILCLLLTAGLAFLPSRRPL